MHLEIGLYTVKSVLKPFPVFLMKHGGIGGLTFICRKKNVGTVGARRRLSRSTSLFLKGKNSSNGGNEAGNSKSGKAVTGIIQYCFPLKAMCTMIPKTARSIRNTVSGMMREMSPRPRNTFIYGWRKGLTAILSITGVPFLSGALVSLA